MTATSALVAILVAMAAIWLLKWAMNNSLRRLRAYDRAADDFEKSAMRLLRYPDLPQIIVDYIDTTNELSAFPRAAARALGMFLSGKRCEKIPEKRQEVEAFIERHPEAKDDLRKLLESGFAMIIHRSSPHPRILLMRHQILGLLRQHLLREEAILESIDKNCKRNGTLKHAA